MRQTYKVLSAWALGAVLIASAASAFTGSTSMSGCPEVQVTVRNVNTATGYGGHISTEIGDGWGGYEPECHITSFSNGTISVLCFDGYLNSGETQDEYRLDLGQRANVESVTYIVSGTGIQVTAVKKSTTGFTTDRNGYVVQGFFPLRRESGFCRASTLYYQTNGVLDGTTSRSGSGYSVSLLKF